MATVIMALVHYYRLQPQRRTKIREGEREGKRMYMAMFIVKGCFMLPGVLVLSFHSLELRLWLLSYGG